ncbi:hypothetical protein PRZ48_012555 [Zasmidium cellare]|uniref:Beta-lactamase-related domain-containing protein n=1 Tax=Zasmidium cellare TaxID=395010 RepID=A0ABR0E5C8_ZASCE|nr:hypothetical protein PRZ48_012555 [Zasmidium cellare]
MQLCWTVFAAALLASTTNAYDNVFDPKLDELIEEWLETDHVPGMSVAVLRNGTLQSKGYGFSILPNVPATADTLYFTGSTTKAFVAATAAHMILNGSQDSDVKWTTPLAKLLPGDFVLADEYATAHVTLEDALSHRSGLPGHEVSYGWTHDASALENVRLMRHLPLTAELRTQWQYNNLMYDAVGVVLERLSGMALESLLRKWLWRPLGMQSTTMSIAQAAKTVDHAGDPRLARGYFWKGEYYIPESYVDLRGIEAAGATISSVQDYALWLQAILCTDNDSSPVTPQIVREVTSPRFVIPPAEGSPSTGLTSYALGWEIKQVGPHPMISHSGGLPGFVTWVYMLPHQNLGFVSMENSRGATVGIGPKVFAEVLRRLDLAAAADALSQSQSQTSAPDAGQVPRLRKRPLPGTVEEYLGVYFHPGYGPLNVSLGSQDLYAPDPPQVPIGPGAKKPGELRIHLASRLWPFTLSTEHDSLAVFRVTVGMRHGGVNHTTHACGHSDTHSRCRYESAWEVSSRGRAIFERNLDGRVDRVGVQLEPAMGGGGWRESMIWFDRVEESEGFLRGEAMGDLRNGRGSFFVR